jgi:carbamoyl-phosphate synthase large subunit
MMHAIDATIGVTGVNATDNPAPGVAVIRSLRHEASFTGRVVGLGYDALDPAFYSEGLLDGGGILPFPSVGHATYLRRLREIARVLHMDAIIPTLDSELRLFARLETELSEAGIATFVPTLDSIERVSKPQLPRLGGDCNVNIPESQAIVSSEAIPELVDRLGLPIVVKGLYYGAQIAHSEADAVAAFHHFAATWGIPVMIQRFLDGDEYNVCALGDGRGNTLGAVAMRKLALTDKGKGWSGVTVHNPGLVAMAETIIGTLSWRGPMEVEILVTRSDGEAHVLEINPRFPAWVYLAAAAGQNLPYVAALLALGLSVPPTLPPYTAGRMFVRISIDQVADLDTFAQLSSRGILLGHDQAPI